MKAHSETNEMEKEHQKPSLVDSFNAIMQGYKPISIIDSKWEKKGDSYVQYSAFDQNVNCSSGLSAQLCTK